MLVVSGLSARGGPADAAALCGPACPPHLAVGSAAQPVRRVEPGGPLQRQEPLEPLQGLESSEGAVSAAGHRRWRDRGQA